MSLGHISRSCVQPQIKEGTISYFFYLLHIRDWSYIGEYWLTPFILWSILSITVVSRQRFIFRIFTLQTAVELNDELLERSRKINYPANGFSSFAYDAIWSIALTLHQSSFALQARNKSLTNITYGDREAAELFRRILRNLTYIGMSVSTRINHCRNNWKFHKERNLFLLHSTLTDENLLSSPPKHVLKPKHRQL